MYSGWGLISQETYKFSPVISNLRIDYQHVALSENFVCYFVETQYAASLQF
jgi:hypothetical protein